MISVLSQLGIVSEDKSFSELTTIRVGGLIKYYFEPKNMYSLIQAIEIIKSEGLKYKIIGNGSNLLCSDEFYDGVVIKLNNINHFELNDDVLYVEAGVPIITAANFAINNGFSGLQWATGIPAFVSGIIYMNASAYNEAISDVIQSVLVYKDGHLEWIEHKDLYFGYRESSFQINKDWIIVAANLKLQAADIEDLKSIAIDRNRRRFDTQPYEFPTCGSVFRNPAQGAVWKIVDDLGLRGKKLNQAQISEKHSNFICNLGGAKAADVNGLINLMIDEAKTKQDIELHLEVERFNW